MTSGSPRVLIYAPAPPARCRSPGCASTPRSCPASTPRSPAASAPTRRSTSAPAPASASPTAGRRAPRRALPAHRPPPRPRGLRPALPAGSRPRPFRPRRHRNHGRRGALPAAARRLLPRLGRPYRSRHPPPLYDRRHLHRRAALFDRAALVLAASQALRDRVLGLGSPPGRTEVHYLGIDRGLFDGVRADAGGRRIAMVGRLVRSKGTHFAIEALPPAPRPPSRRRARDPRRRPGAPRASKRQAAGLPVTFLGAGSQRDARALLARARRALPPLHHPRRPPRRNPRPRRRRSPGHGRAGGGRRHRRHPRGRPRRRHRPPGSRRPPRRARRGARAPADRRRPSTPGCRRRPGARAPTASTRAPTSPASPTATRACSPALSAPPPASPRHRPRRPEPHRDHVARRHRRRPRTPARCAVPLAGEARHRIAERRTRRLQRTDARQRRRRQRVAQQRALGRDLATGSAQRCVHVAQRRGRLRPPVVGQAQQRLLGPGDRLPRPELLGRHLLPVALDVGRQPLQLQPARLRCEPLGDQRPRRVQLLPPPSRSAAPSARSAGPATPSRPAATGSAAPSSPPAWRRPLAAPRRAPPAAPPPPPPRHLLGKAHRLRPAQLRLQPRPLGSKLDRPRLQQLDLPRRRDRVARQPQRRRILQPVDPARQRQRLHHPQARPEGIGPRRSARPRAHRSADTRSPAPSAELAAPPWLSPASRVIDPRRELRRRRPLRRDLAQHRQRHASRGARPRIRHRRRDTRRPAIRTRSSAPSR